MKLSFLPFILLCITVSPVFGQEDRVKGKIIKDYGPTFSVEAPDIKTNVEEDLKVIFDVSRTSEEKSVRNKYIETAARFLNMHAEAGMDAEQLHVTMTIHGSAWQDILTDEAYSKKYGVPNPNSAMIKALNEVGVEIILCGQTASYRNIKDEDIIPEVKKALSAMTALIQYQNKGYRFIKF